MTKTIRARLASVSARAAGTSAPASTRAATSRGANRIAPGGRRDRPVSEALRMNLIPTFVSTPSLAEHRAVCGPGTDQPAQRWRIANQPSTSSHRTTFGASCSYTYTGRPFTVSCVLPLGPPDRPERRVDPLDPALHRALDEHGRPRLGTGTRAAHLAARLLLDVPGVEAELPGGGQDLAEIGRLDHDHRRLRRDRGRECGRRRCCARARRRWRRRRGADGGWTFACGLCRPRGASVTRGSALSYNRGHPMRGVVRWSR